MRLLECGKGARVQQLKKISWRLAIILLMVGMFVWPTGAWFRDSEVSAENKVGTAILDATLTSMDADFVPVAIGAGETASRLVTVRNVGNLPFVYELQPDFGLQSNLFCSALEITFEPINSVTGLLLPGSADDYLVKASMPIDASFDLINSSCHFDIRLLALQQEFAPEKVGFWDEEWLTNTVTSGDWRPNVCSTIRGYKLDDTGKGLADWNIVILPASRTPVETVTIMASDMDGEVTTTVLDENKVYVVDVENNPSAEEEILLMNGLDVTGKTGLVLSDQAGSLEFSIKEPEETDDGGFFVRIYEVSDLVVSTNKNGYYSKEVCEPGHYRIMEVPQNGWEQISPSSSSYKLTLPVDREFTFVNKKKPVKLLINEVYYDVDSAHGTDGGGSQSDEWVELYNPNDFPVNLKKWVLVDNNKGGTVTNRNVYIPPGGFAVLAKAAQTWTYWSIPKSAVKIETGNVIGDLANNGDRVVLKDALGNEIDAVSWGSDEYAFGVLTGTSTEKLIGGNGKSIVRKVLGLDTDMVTDWKVNEGIPTPGTHAFTMVVTKIMQDGNDLKIGFENAAGFDRVKYFLTYERLDDEGLLVPESTAPNEATKPELSLTLDLDPIYLGTCSDDGLVCIPHLGVNNGQVSLLYYLGNKVLGVSTVPFSWTDTP